MLSVDQVKKRMEELQRFVDLAESYKPETIEQRVIKEYAYYPSRRIVAENLNSIGLLYNGRSLEVKDVADIIKSKTIDDLHRLVKAGFMNKTKTHRQRAAKDKSYRKKVRL